MLRSTTDNLTGETQRVIDFAGLAEIRPDDGIMLWRVPVNGAVTVEEARSLATGARDINQSGYIHTDLRGSTLAKTGWDAQMSLPFEEAEYGPWGETFRVSAANTAPTHQFVGFEPDPATGWYFMGARVYDPTLRRWLSPDPLLLAAPEVDSAKGIELNLYSYTGNNPIIYTDPDGTCRLNGVKVDCFSAAWDSYKAITAATAQSFREGHYGDAAVGTVLGTAQTVNVGAGFVAQGFADVWNGIVDAKGGNYTPLAVATGTAAIPGGVGKLSKGVTKSAATHSASVASKHATKQTEKVPKLWKIERYDKAGKHPGVGQVYKDGDTLWVDLKGGHGGAEWKVYKKDGSNWSLKHSADKYGEFMKNKHESGKFDVIKNKDISWTKGK